LAKDDATQDWYGYLVHERGQWKLEAVRTLALTGILALQRQQLQRKPSRTAEEDWALENLNLLFKSDAELKRFLMLNVNGLQDLATLVIEGKQEVARVAAKALFLIGADQKDGRVEMIIGGVLDNTVGFAYVPSGAAPPAIAKDDYIYVERVTDRWYVFKTT
jgi:hypothetical protein